MRKQFENTLRSFGYTAVVEFGFSKDTIEYFESKRIIIRHWVTLFDQNPMRLLMHGYIIQEGVDDDEKKYDTGIVEMTVEQLSVFIEVLCK